MVPNYHWKMVSGWSNYSGKVISHKMNENEMGYRGSKSEFVSQPNFVKEQRVDGSYCIANSNHMQLRCTLMGFERNYQVKIPANQLNNRSFSTLSTQPVPLALAKGNTINPWFLTGFSDAEGSFIISIYRDEKSKTGWRITPNFSIHIHIKDIALLEGIRNTLGVGKVRKNSSRTAVFRVDNIQELQVIVDHFTNYPLIGFKVSDFLLFKECYDLIKQKQHLTQEGLEKIVALKCNLNKGLTVVLMEAFPNIVAIPRPHYKFNGILNPNWISGFVAGDSTFCVTIERSTENKVGGVRRRVRLIFGTCLHIRDKELLIGIANYFKLDEGKYIYDSVTLRRETSLLQIKNMSDIINKIIPFFNQYPILPLPLINPLALWTRAGGS
uniref:LAGLIDADG homing endonuclease n=1 Tax=Termitomyces sp. TaxID=1916073 RepID=A0A386TYW1_9AGAR|nr:LAGLIDADG homing endonuclease [Termitomyces sp.]AYE93311.1 LAGLIDADG homing endonuclease [Termitomyces sp.]